MPYCIYFSLDTIIQNIRIQTYTYTQTHRVPRRKCIIISTTCSIICERGPTYFLESTTQAAKPSRWFLTAVPTWKVRSTNRTICVHLACSHIKWWPQ